MYKMLLKALLIWILISSNSLSVENKIWDNWYFGRRAAITFNTPDRMPKALTNSQINTLEGCASISDTNSNLLFYTNGVLVYNKNGDVMPNGEGLKGHYSSTQSALVIKRPKSKDLYHIFTTDKGPYEGDSPHELCMSVVDMSMENGLGDVIYKNYAIYSPVIEKLTAIQHANGEDFWILARGMNDNKFVISLLTDGGLVSTKTMEFGPTYFPYPASPEFSLGQLKANPKGDMLATVVYGANNIELYKFDNLKGEILSYQGIPVNETVTALYGLEFASNNKYLYVNNLYGRIYQYDVSQLDSVKIDKSMKIVFDSLDYNFQKFGQMQLAPNGKIYMALSYDTALAVIHKPNVPYPFCRYDPKNVGLGGRISLFGLPNNVITGVYYSVDAYGKNICAGFGDSLELFSTVYPEDIGYSYLWTGPKGFTSTLPNPKILKADKSASGTYVCNVSIDDKFFKSDSVELNVYDIPKAEIDGPKSICPPEKIILSSKYQAPEYIYKWSNGSNEQEILISSPGDYYLIVTNPAGCYDSIYHKVVNNDNLAIEFESRKKICKGTPLLLSLKEEYYKPLSNFSFKWSTGDTSLSTWVNKPGWYSVTVVREGGCSGIDSIFVGEVDPPKVELNVTGDYFICKGDSLLIEPKQLNPAWTYEWSDGFPNHKRMIYTSGKYTLIVNNQGSCNDSSSVNVVFEDKPDVELEFDNEINLCFGDSVIIRPKNYLSTNNYKWSSNSDNHILIVKETGKYILTANNKAGCFDSAVVEVFVAPKIEVKIIADKNYLCLTDSVTLSANTRYSHYKWSNGDTNDFVRVYEPGKYTLIAENSFGCKDTAEINISEINFTSSIAKDFITVDSICQGDNFTETLSLIYNSDQGLQINDIEYKGDNFDFFIEDAIQEPVANQFLQKIEFTLGKNKPGIYRGEIIITIEKPCYNQFSIPIFIKVYADYTFKINQIIAQPGDSVCITIDATLNCGNSDDNLYSPEFNVNIKSLYFYPSYSKGGSIVRNFSDGQDRIIKVKFDSLNFIKNEPRRMEICGIALSGQKPKSIIFIDSIDWSNDLIYSKLFDGSILVEGCSQNLRVMQIYKPISISISPFPANNFVDINVSSQELGKHFVEIYTIDGRLVENIILDGFRENHSQSIKLPASDLDQGLYMVIVKSPWNILRGNILIIKD